jgi:tetratricopeptide (TPR) repeat protein
MPTSRSIAVVALLAASCSCRCVERGRAADALQERGKALLEGGKLEGAGKALRGAFDRHIALPDHAGASVDARLLSRVHSAGSRYDEALRWVEVARAEAVASGQPQPIGGALIWLGNLHDILGDVPHADEAYEEAEGYLSPDDAVEHARLRIYRGRNRGLLGHWAEAAQLLEEGLRLAKQAGNRGLIRAACINLASLAMERRRLDDADRYLREARESLRPADGETAWRALWLHEAILARERGNLAEATALLDRAEAGAPRDTAWEIARERALVAEQAGRLDEAERHYATAIEIVEQMRRESAPSEIRAPFLEERWEPFGNLFDLQLRRQDVHGALATLARAQGRMFLDALAVSFAEQRGSSSRAASAIGRLHGLQEIAPLLQGSSLAGAPPGPALPALRGRHVLAYFSGRRRMRLIAVVDGQPRATPVDISPKELDALLGDFEAHPDDEQAAAKLGAALVPVEALPPDGGRLHIIPTGPLLRLSFAALRVGGQRLLDRHEIVYAPSVTSLATGIQEREPTQGPGILIADTFSNLANVGEELRAVVEQTGAEPHTGSKATVVALRAAQRAPLLHVISHSGLDRRGGYLALAGGEKVTAAKILEWRIRPRLVVLPTCGSAATVRGDMWDSLATAFLASGSGHVVATLVSVQDSVAAEFTRLFYAQGGLADPVGATARAQRLMASTHKVEAWSAFMAAGL